MKINVARLEDEEVFDLVAREVDKNSLDLSSDGEKLIEENGVNEYMFKFDFPMLTDNIPAERF